ncbi:unnamed protein product [Bemisia tabaci]|uniref:RING-type domain-containing protein n=1 Tax=Bemisia tabaci TaxID=7038 RepID=A0A9P0A975_BEMTA|nr:unnamed protein product [Bemisia tabaci]
MSEDDPPFILLEPNTFSDVSAPLKSSNRIKYTCFTASQSFLIFGATSGGLYVFYREPFAYSQLIPNKEGAVSLISVSPNEAFIAFATLKGVVGILERNEGLGARMINRSVEHADSEVTTLQWSENNLQVFAGDKSGKISVLNLTSAMSKTMFQVPVFTLMQLDSQVVQMSCQSGLLLASTLTRCYICDTIKEQYKQVGQKLRDGEFGACFMPVKDALKIFCARPGSRLWKCDTDGIVEATYELKKALAVPPATVVSLYDEPKIIARHKDTTWNSQSFNFNQLLVVHDKYLLTFKNDGVYFFNVDSNVNVLLWSNHVKNIADLKCVGDSIYMYTTTGEVHALKVMSLDKCLLRLFYKDMFLVCAELCALHLSTLLKWNKLTYLYHLKELENHLLQINQLDLLSDLKPLFNKLQKINHSPISKLDSGIFLVENHHLNSQIINNSSSFYSSQSKVLHKRQERFRRRRRSYSLSCESKKKKLLDKTLSKSLPNLNEAVKIPHDYVSEMENNENDFDEPYSDDLGEYDSNVPFPFLMLANPDAFHDTLLELGTNVTEKLVDGTRSLHEKWQILEGKLRLLKSDTNNEESIISDNYLNSKSRVNIVPDFDETQSIVDRPRKKKSHLPDINITNMLQICDELDNLLEGDLKADNVFKFLNEVVKLFSDYQSKLKKLKTTANLQSSLLPFSRYFKEKEIFIIQRVFHEALKSDLITEWHQENESALKNLNFKKSNYPTLLLDFHSENEIALDEFVSQLLSVFSEILDPFLILQCLNCTSMKCSYESFCTILHRFQNGDFQFVANSKDCSDVNYSEWPLALLLNTMFLMLRLDQIETSSQMGIEGKVNLRFVVYTIMKLKMHLSSTGLSAVDAREKCHRLFLLYLSKLLVKNYPISLYDDIVLAYVVNSFLSINSTSSFSSCSNCCFPSFGVNLPPLKFAEIGYLIIDHFWSLHLQQCTSADCSADSSQSNISSKVVVLTDLKAILNNDPIQEAKKEKLLKLVSGCVTPSLKEIITICQCIPRLWKYVLSLTDVILYIPSAVSLMIQLNLITRSNNMLTVKNINLFEKVIILNIICKRGVCLNCGYKNSLLSSMSYGVPWTELCCIILKCIDSKTTIDLLQKYSDEIPSTSLDLCFYQCAILSEMVDAHQTGLREKVVNLVSSSSKGVSGIPVLSPDVAAAFDTAARLDGISDFCYQKREEDSPENHHWGVRLDLSEEFCHLCSLSLGAKALIAANNGGLIAFKCGHTYHAVCLKHQNSHATVCTLCYSS